MKRRFLLIIVLFAAGAGLVVAFDIAGYQLTVVETRQPVRVMTIAATDEQPIALADSNQVLWEPEAGAIAVAEAEPFDPQPFDSVPPTEQFAGPDVDPGPPELSDRVNVPVHDDIPVSPEPFGLIATDRDDLVAEVPAQSGKDETTAAGAEVGGSPDVDVNPFGAEEPGSVSTFTDADDLVDTREQPVAGNPEPFDDVFSGDPEGWVEARQRPEPLDSSLRDVYQADPFLRERLELFIRELREKQRTHGNRHPEIMRLRKAIEFEARRAIQRRHDQQKQEIEALRARLAQIERRLEERAQREDQIVAMMLAGLTASPAPAAEPTGVLAGDPFSPHPETEPLSGQDPYAVLATPALAPAEAAGQPTSAVGNGIPPVSEELPDPGAEADELLRQVTVRIQWACSFNEGFLSHGNLDGVLFSQHGLIVTALPPEIVEVGEVNDVEFTITYPENRTSTSARPVSIDKETGLLSLEPELLPEGTPKIDLFPGPVQTGSPVWVATVNDGQFNPEDLEVSVRHGRARNLLSRSGTPSRLATDIPTRTGSGGAPLLTRNVALAGIMSADRPGQYISIDVIAQVLQDDGDLVSVTERNSQNVDQPAPQPSGGASPTSQQAIGFVELDSILTLQQQLVAARLDAQDAHEELSRVQKLRDARVATDGELDVAQREVRRRDKLLDALEKSLDVRLRSAGIAERYVATAQEVALAAYDKAVEANRRVSGAVPETELRRLQLEVQKFQLQRELTKQTLSILAEMADTAASDSEDDSEPVQSNRRPEPLNESIPDLELPIERNQPNDTEPVGPPTPTPLNSQTDPDADGPDSTVPSNNSLDTKTNPDDSLPGVEPGDES
ncbi:MAG: hypothetical protein ACYTGL_18955 [Planctomycetota bacterium]|jgi:hypothetical protein